jgi:hypothetical protein
MKMPGCWVEKTTEGVSLTRTVFDETDLDPATNWKEAWQNQDPESAVRGYVPIEAALARARQLLPDGEAGVASPLPAFSDEVLNLRSKAEVDLFAKSVK